MSEQVRWACASQAPREQATSGGKAELRRPWVQATSAASDSQVGAWAPGGKPPAQGNTSTGPASSVPGGQVARGQATSKRKKPEGSKQARTGRSDAVGRGEPRTEPGTHRRSLGKAQRADREARQELGGSASPARTTLTIKNVREQFCRGPAAPYLPGRAPSRSQL